MLVVGHHGVVQVVNVRRRAVEAPRTRGRHDVGRVTRQKQVAVPHGLGHERAQRRNRLFNGRAGHQLLGNVGGQAAFEFVPEGLVGPIFHAVAQWHLDVVAAQHLRAQGTQRKPALVFGVHQFGRHGFGARQHAQPAERVNLFVFLQHVGGNGLAADAVETIGPDDKVAVDAHHIVAVAVGDIRGGAGQVVGLHVLGVVNHHAFHAVAGFVQVAGEFGLAVHHH